MRPVAVSIVGLLLAILAWNNARGAEALCDVGLSGAATGNSASLTSMGWSPFGRRELGWAVYAPLIGEEIGTPCPPASAGFAAALAIWQAKHGQIASGSMDQVTFLQMKQIWQSRRPFVAASRAMCPPPPTATTLEQIAPNESYGGKQIFLLANALTAYRRLIAAARTELPTMSRDPQLLTIFSGYRSPDYDAARCLRDGNCQGVVRASCSAHRTGAAVDLYLGAAPGYAPDSSDDANRLFLSRSASYLWLVHNALRFGFVNYAFEPWHWEWIGQS